MAKLAIGKVNLYGKLDLSMWQGEFEGDDDEEDKDLSPTIPTNIINNPINGGSNLAVPFTQVQKTDDLLNSSPHDGHFPKINENEENKKSTGDRLQEQSQNANKQEKENAKSRELRESEQPTKEQLKVSARKVDFVEGGNSSSMGTEGNKKTIGSIALGRGHSSKRNTRSGSLLQEIRKMSLASQDAEEEKRKQAASNAASSTNPTKRTVRRVRRRKQEEEYTDKDRAAASTLGSRDIKQSLKAKKKRERKMRLSIDFLNSEEYLASMLVIEGLYQLRVKKTPKDALSTLNKALELQPNHKGALVARSQVHLKLGDANSALKDAETSFDKSETFIQGLYMYAESLYQLGEFEKSLIAFHQGYQLRKDMEGFRIGVQKSQDAIKRAIGGPTATKMANLDEILSIIEELQESKRKTISSCKDDELLLNILRRRFGEKVTTSITKHNAKCKNQWITREVLGQMHADKEYLANFIHRPDVKQQMGHADTLCETAKDGLKYLESREKFWRQQNPLYSRRTMVNIINNNGLLSKLHSSANKPDSVTVSKSSNQISKSAIKPSTVK